MKLKGKTVLWLVASVAFITGVKANRASDNETNGPQATAEVDSIAEAAPNEASIIDEVIWVVGDEPILLSDVEITR